MGTVFRHKTYLPFFFILDLRCRMRRFCVSKSNFLRADRVSILHLYREQTYRQEFSKKLSPKDTAVSKNDNAEIIISSFGQRIKRFCKRKRELPLSTHFHVKDACRHCPSLSLKQIYISNGAAARKCPKNSLISNGKNDITISFHKLGTAALRSARLPAFKMNHE